ncbi:MAG: capsule assembly Wzi family protein [Roseivirga sp.]|nr:capsule assembly Wzi family protein [Roseivirga sp.]
MKLSLTALFSVLVYIQLSAQTLPVGTPVIEDYLRRQQLLGKVDSTISFSFRPFHFGENGLTLDTDIFQPTDYFQEKLSFFKGKGLIKLLPAELRLSYDSNHPDSRNNGAMIRSRGAQTLLSVGVFAKIGPLSLQLKPEFVYAQNKNYKGFSEDHFDVIWSRRYIWFNNIDTPERYGNRAYKKFLPGQSSLRLNKWGMSLGISTENLWWGPAIRNSIMMSNNAQGFPHVTFNTSRPLKTKVGSFEWQFVTGRLESSGHPPPDTTRTYTGRTLYVPKIEDSRYFQGFSLSYSPKWVPGFTFGLTRWVQAYTEFIKETDDYFPAFSNLFRNNDNNTGGRDELQRDQAAGAFIRWVWPDSKAEIYAEFHRNDASANFRDLILNSEHSSATTIGIHKLFDTKVAGRFIQFNWEWTEMAQGASTVLRGTGSWYTHSRVRQGYTHNGEVLGSAIGPGSNAHYLSVARVEGKNRIGVALERLVHNNDFLRRAFENSQDFRRYWVDYNIHAFADLTFDKFIVSGNIMYTRALNYQWELFHIPFTLPYYVPGTDRGNLHLEFKVAYILK